MLKRHRNIKILFITMHKYKSHRTNTIEGNDDKIVPCVSEAMKPNNHN